jgi:hypothetical protein
LRRRLCRSRHREPGLERGEPRTVRVANRFEFLSQSLELLTDLLWVGLLAGSGGRARLLRRLRKGGRCKQT